jgi:hypothetical protein
MSLLHEMEQFGLADCEFNRRLTRIHRLINLHLPNFNMQQEDEFYKDYLDDDSTYEPITAEQAKKDEYFIYWCSQWDDSRSELFYLLKKINSHA